MPPFSRAEILIVKGAGKQYAANLRAGKWRTSSMVRPAVRAGNPCDQPCSVLLQQEDTAISLLCSKFRPSAATLGSNFGHSPGAHNIPYNEQRPKAQTSWLAWLQGHRAVLGSGLPQSKGACCRPYHLGSLVVPFRAIRYDRYETFAAEEAAYIAEAKCTDLADRMPPSI